MKQTKNWWKKLDGFEIGDLKDNTISFKYLDKKFQKAFKKMGMENRVYLGYDGYWHSDNQNINPGVVYRLNENWNIHSELDEEEEEDSLEDRIDNVLRGKDESELYRIAEYLLAEYINEEHIEDCVEHALENYAII